jgi:hypothetical protein
MQHGHLSASCKRQSLPSAPGSTGLTGCTAVACEDATKRLCRPLFCFFERLCLRAWWLLRRNETCWNVSRYTAPDAAAAVPSMPLHAASSSSCSRVDDGGWASSPLSRRQRRHASLTDGPSVGVRRGIGKASHERTGGGFQGQSLRFRARSHAGMPCGRRPSQVSYSHRGRRRACRHVSRAATRRRLRLVPLSSPSSCLALAPVHLSCLERAVWCCSGRWSAAEDSVVTDPSARVADRRPILAGYPHSPIREVAGASPRPSCRERRCP